MRKLPIYEQTFIKDQTMTVSQLIAVVIGNLGENISVKRFARFKVGDVAETVAVSKAQDQSAE
jgi:elongation factor Ts